MSSFRDFLIEKADLIESWGYYFKISDDLFCIINYTDNCINPGFGFISTKLLNRFSSYPHNNFRDLTALVNYYNLYHKELFYIASGTHNLSKEEIFDLLPQNIQEAIIFNIDEVWGKND